MIRRAALASLVFAATALAQQALPPDHPPLGGEVPKAPARKPPPIDPSSGAAALPAGHPPMSDAGTIKVPDAVELMKQLDQTADLKAKEKTFEVAAALGKLYYAHARYPDAVEYLGQAVAKAEAARAFYAEQKAAAAKAKKPIPPGATVGCAPGPESTLESMLQLGRDKAKAKDPGAAAACTRVGLHALMEVEGMLGAAKVITGDRAGALAVYERQLALFETNPEAMYGRGALLLDLKGDDPKALAQAKADLDRYTQDYPMASRAKQAKAFLTRIEGAIAAGGVTALARAHTAKKKEELAKAPPPPAGQQPPKLTQEMIDAVQNTERTPELEEGLKKLVEEGEEHLAKGRFQEALDAYKRVVPFQPENGRAKAGMAWALVGLNRQPMAQNIWNVAVGADPAAVNALGDTLEAKGDTAGARALWQRLKETAPGYAQGAKLEEKLQ